MAFVYGTFFTISEIFIGATFPHQKTIYVVIGAAFIVVFRIFTLGLFVFRFLVRFADFADRVRIVFVSFRFFVLVVAGIV